MVTYARAAVRGCSLERVGREAEGLDDGTDKVEVAHEDLLSSTA